MDINGKDDWSKKELEEYFNLKTKLATGLKGEEYNKTLKRYMYLKSIAKKYVENHRDKYKLYEKESK